MNEALLQLRPEEEEVLHVFETTYGADTRYERLLSSFIRITITRLRETVGSLAAVRGKSFLDLGCGSDQRLASLADTLRSDDVAYLRSEVGRCQPPPNYFTLLYHPWLCRVLGVAGASHVAGVDIYETIGEPYEHRMINLEKMKNLEMHFADSSFDVVHTHKLIDAVHDGSYTAPNFDETYKTMPIEKHAPIVHELIFQVQRILKEGGYFFFNQTEYKKENGNLRQTRDDMTVCASSFL